MTQTRTKPKASAHRGTKLVIASLSVAATMGGWAVLTAAQTDTPPTEDMADLSAQVQDVQPISNAVTVPPSLIKPLPNLAELPVRGLREVSADMPPPPSSGGGQGPANNDRQGGGGAPPQAQAPPPPRNHNGGGGGKVSQPAPQPKPKPVRHTKSSK